MIYKLGTLEDYERVKESLPEAVRDILRIQVMMLDGEYGAQRDVEEDDGGYVLYCGQGCREEELLAQFDYRETYPEFGCLHEEVTPPMWGVVYLCSNEYAVTLYIHDGDLPEAIRDEIE